MSTLSSVIEYDLFGNRPSAGIAGRLFFASDTKNQYRDNGSSWDNITPGGGGAINLITETVTSGSQATVTFSAISASYRDLVVIVRGRLAGTGAADADLALQFNGDTGGNYQFQNAKVASTVFTGSRGTGTTGLYIGTLPAENSPANLSGGVKITIFDYKGTTFYKWMNSRGLDNDSAGETPITRDTSGSWLNTAAITSVTVLMYPSEAGHFVDNSVVSLYGST